MKRIIAAELCKLDQPNKNGRIYPTAAMEAAIAQIKDPLMGTIGELTSVVDLSQVAFMASNLRIEDGKLLGEINITQTPKGYVLEQVISEMAFRTVGTGVVGEDGVVRDYQLTCVAAVPKDEAA